MSPNEIFSQNNTSTVSFEEMENMFKTPTQRQDYYEQGNQATAEGDLSQLSNPDGTAFMETVEPEAIQPVDPEKAMRTGERIARAIDMGIDFTLSNFVAHNDESYRADEKDLEDIAQCWGEISQEHNWNIGPEWSLGILYVMVYGPLVKQAITDRRMAELESRQRMLEERIRNMESKENDPTKHTARPSAVNGIYSLDPQAD